MKVKFYDHVDDTLIKFAVIFSRYQGKWVYCKHKERSTYEAPGGHREVGESIEMAAKREVYEETGAVDYDIKPVCIYEIEEVRFFDDLPQELTYPLIQPVLLSKLQENNYIKE